MTAIIFGASGQDGFYLERLLKSKSINVISISRNIINGIGGDVSDKEFVFSVVKEYKPDYIFHFAAISTTKHHQLFENSNAICTGLLNILESIKHFNLKTKVFISGSAMQFKNTGDPINEESEFSPSSPYSVFRISSVYLARYYREYFGIDVYVGYLFNHDSPLRTENHVNQKIISAVKRILNKEQKVLELGNIDVKKEFNFAGDIVESIWILVNQNRFYEAVLGSGVSHSIKEWLDVSFSLAGLNWQDYVVVDDTFVPEYKQLVSDPKRIKSLGWAPKNDLKSLAEMMYHNTI
jgi:GDPmannose 4,6-dehydratase